MHKERILVVDDEPEYLEFLKVFLVSRGYTLDTACDGEQAKDFLERNIYRVVFFDCNMPGLSGIELTKVIDVRNPDAKKVMISGYDLIDDEFAAASGIDMFLRKPFSLKDVEKAID